MRELFKSSRTVRYGKTSVSGAWSDKLTNVSLQMDIPGNCYPTAEPPDLEQPGNPVDRLYPRASGHLYPEEFADPISLEPAPSESSQRNNNLTNVRFGGGLLFSIFCFSWISSRVHWVACCLSLPAWLLIVLGLFWFFYMRHSR